MIILTLLESVENQGGIEKIILSASFILFVFVIPLIALVDIIKSTFEGNNKIVWAIVVIFFGTLGAIIYFIIGKNKKILKSK